MGRPVGSAVSFPFAREHWGKWREQALCLDYRHELWFEDEDKDKIALAKAVCAKCPVKQECLDYAIETKPEYGIFGGLSPSEFAKLEPKEVHNER